MRTPIAWFAAVFLLSCVGCGGGAAQDKPGTGSLERSEPDYVVVQHILIGFQGSMPGKEITRTREEAEALAREIFGRARAGEDFDVLVETYTDDAFPGVYEIANRGARADASRLVYARDKMVPAFGDVGFSLEVGEVGLAQYDATTSKYGWHIIKRLE